MSERSGPGLGAVLVIHDGAGSVLLTRRREGGYRGGLWCLPGGFVEGGEGYVAAALRESREEIGVEPRIEGLYAAYSNAFPGGRETATFVLLARLAKDAGLRPGDDATELRWLAPDEGLPPMAFEADAHVIARFRSGDLTTLPAESRLFSIQR
jgi:8-oxo-dGTP diphosphatase